MEKTLADTKAFLDRKKEEVQEVAELGSEAVFEVLVEEGNNLELLDNKEKIPENQVSGCQSATYISVHVNQGRVSFKGASDALVVKGQLAILLHALTGLPPQDVLSAKPLLESFVRESGIQKSMIRSRTNAFANMFARIERELRAKHLL
ncbi:MAG: SufE family protein [Candidatus Woesearchaeota archaeon]|nr:MAG: SufE family protein [Candidatus Woesearchaeota archaeon]